MNKYYPYDSNIKYYTEIEDYFKDKADDDFSDKLFLLTILCEHKDLPDSLKCVFPSYLNEKYNHIVEGAKSYLKEFDSYDEEELPVFIIDFSITKNGKSGFAFTEDAIYYHNVNKSTMFFYSDIYSVEQKGNNVIINDDVLSIPMFDAKKIKDIIIYCTALYQDDQDGLGIDEDILPYELNPEFHTLQKTGLSPVEYIVRNLHKTKNIVTYQSLSDDAEKKRVQRFVIEYQKGKQLPPLTWNDIYIFFDSSISRNGSSGYLLTKKGIFYLNAPAWGKKKQYFSFQYNEIHHIQILTHQCNYDGEDKGIKINSSFIGENCHYADELYFATYLLTSYHQYKQKI